MDFVLTILVLVLALAALAYPLYRAQTRAATVNASTLDDLLAQRDGVYATLRDLELDEQLGKLDSGDYAVLRERYMLRAAEILQELDVLRGQGPGQAASAEIEQEVAALRKNPTNDDSPKSGLGRTTKDKGKPVVRGESAKKDTAAAEMFCTNCGRPYKVGDKFCARCGKALA